MERIMKRFEQQYRRSQDAITQWQSSSSRLSRQFNNASAILDRLPILENEENYGILRKAEFAQNQLVAQQLETLEIIFLSMRDTLCELEKTSKLLEKIWRDGCNILKSEKIQPTSQHAQQRMGSSPSINDCINGLESLHIMYRDEYLLKASIVLALDYNISSKDVAALQVVLHDQPNIPPSEVQEIYLRIFGG